MHAESISLIYDFNICLWTKGDESGVIFPFSSQVSGAYDLRVVAKSHLATADGDEFGSHNVGPVPKPNSTDYSNRAACLEFRCPGFIRDGSKEIYDLPTVVTGRLLTGNKQMICNMRYSRHFTYLEES